MLPYHHTRLYFILDSAVVYTASCNLVAIAIYNFFALLNHWLEIVKSTSKNLMKKLLKGPIQSLFALLCL